MYILLHINILVHRVGRVEGEDGGRHRGLRGAVLRLAGLD